MKLEEIIEGCQCGQKKCQEQLVRQYAPVLFPICKRYTRAYEHAQDALQETFINIFKYINNYSGIGSFEGWMKRIAVNCSITYQKKYFQNYQDEKTLEDSVIYSELPDVYSKMGVEDIIELMSNLPQSLHTIFSLHVVEGYSHREISELLQISEGTSRAALSRARNRLVELMEEKKTIEEIQFDKLAFATLNL